MDIDRSLIVGEPLSGEVLDEKVILTRVELCRIGRIDTEQLVEMVAEGVLDVQGSTMQSWRFDVVALKRMQIALRLQRDLRVNLAGVALVLELLDELDQLRTQSALQK